MTDKNKTLKLQNAPVLLIGLVAMSGCNPMAGFDRGSTGTVYNGNSAPAYEHTIAERIPPSNAFVELPSYGGEIVDVVQTRHSNGVEQSVIYQGDTATRGENVVQVKMMVHVDGKKRTSRMKMGGTSAHGLSAEMMKALPGIYMQVSDQSNVNAYGPFGYALGRAPGKVRCIYGWQQMMGSKSDRWATFKRNSRKPRLSVRLRVCRSNVTNDQLVGLMQNLRINADPAAALRPTAVSWNSGQARRSNTRSTGILPQYEQPGYVSQQRDIYEEPTSYQPVSQKVVKRVKRRSVAKPNKRVVHQDRYVPVVERYQTVNRTNVPTYTYNPPLPNDIKPSRSVTVKKTIVPVPHRYYEVKPKPAPAIAVPLVTARTYPKQTYTPGTYTTKTYVTPTYPRETVKTHVVQSPVNASGRHSTVPLPY